MLKNDAAAVQLHFLSGNVQLAQCSLPGQGDQQTPVLRIAQRMRLEKTQLEGVDRRIQVSNCLVILSLFHFYVHILAYIHTYSVLIVIS